MIENILVLRRVSYGVDKTPIEDREYKIRGCTGPVGNKNDWLNFGNENNYSMIEFTERDGTIKIFTKCRLCKTFHTDGTHGNCGP